MTDAAATPTFRRWGAAVLAVVLGLSGAILPGVPAESAVTYSISGHVDIGDSSRSAVAGEAQVFALYPNNSSLSAIVDADGNYTISGLAPRKYVLQLKYLGSEHFSGVYYPSAPVNFSSGMWTNPSPGPLDPTPVTVTDSNISGRDFVAPLDGEVTIHVDHGDASHPAVTGSATVDGSALDADGNIVRWYDIGNRTIIADSVLYDWERGTTTAGVVSGPQTVTVTLPPIGVVTGRVTLGAIGNYAGLGEVTLALRGLATSDLPFKFVTTDAAGYFSISARKGQYYLTATMTDGLEFQPLQQYVETSPSSQLVSNFVMLPAARITGSVTVDGRPAVEGEVVVSYTYVHGATRSVTTKSDGTYDLRGLTSDYGELTYRHVDDRYPINSTSSYPVTSTVLTKNVQLSLGGTISGHVGGKKWKRAWVVAQWAGASTGSWPPEYRTQVDAVGDYHLPNLPAGKYAIRFETGQYPGGPDMFWGQSYSDYRIKIVTVAPGDDLVGYDMTMYDGSALQGNLYCTNCPAVPEDSVAFVYLQYQSGSRWIDVPGADVSSIHVTEGNRYAMRPSFPGTYRVIVRPYGALKRYLSAGASPLFTATDKYLPIYRDVMLTRAGATPPPAAISRPSGGWQKPSPLSSLRVPGPAADERSTGSAATSEGSRAPSAAPANAGTPSAARMFAGR